jgi:hypothetical protein
MTGSGDNKLYSLGDNVARQQLSEPFSRKVGLGIDTSTGSVSLSETDLSVPGQVPLSFTRYYHAQSDRYGTLGYRWSHTYDTRLVFAEDDVYATRQQAIAFGQRMPGGPYSLTSGFAPPHVVAGADCINPAGEGMAYYVREELLDEITDVVVHGVIT